MSREFDAILLALDFEGNPERLGQFDTLVSDLDFDWTYLRKLLDRHRVLALFVSALRRFERLNAMPEVHRAETERQARALQLRQLSKVGGLLDISKALEGREIEFLCLKGPVLGALLYGDPVLRHFGDLDIFVNRDEVVRAISVLLELGFELCDLKDIQHRDPSDPVWKHLYHIHLRKRDLMVELHWRLSRNDRMYDIPFDQLYQGRQSVLIGGVVLYTLGNEHLLDYIALHGASHCWNRLKWLCDGRLLIDSIASLESGASTANSVRLMNGLVHRFWAVKSSAGESYGNVSIINLCSTQLLSSSEYPGAFGNVVRRTRVVFSLYPTLRSKVEYIVGLFVWPQVYELVRLSKRWAFLYYFLGPVLWAKSVLLGR